MAKYNLTDAQQRVLAEMVKFYTSQGSQPLVHFQADQADVLLGAGNSHIKVAMDDLRIFEQEGLVSLRSKGSDLTTIVTVRQSAHDAIANDFEKPTLPPAIGQAGQVVFGNVSGSTFQTAIGDHNTLHITNADAAEVLKAITALVGDLRPLVQESLPADEAAAAEADLQEIEQQAGASQPDKRVLSRRLKSLGRKFVDAVDYYSPLVMPKSLPNR